MFDADQSTTAGTRMACVKLCFSGFHINFWIVNCILIHERFICGSNNFDGICNSFCVAYTKCNPHLVIIRDIYSFIYLYTRSKSLSHDPRRRLGSS